MMGMQVPWHPSGSAPRKGWGLVFFCMVLVGWAQAQQRPNILFIAIDDLNDWVGCLGGHPQALTPNIDALADQGTLFTNAHCQAPICGPSRASIMTGLLPSSSGNYLQLRDRDIKRSNRAVREAVFLPDYLERQGYKTMGVGKIFHDGDGAGTLDEYGGVFEKFGPKPERRFHYDPAWFGKPGGTQTDWGAFPERDAQMPDYKSAAWAVDRLNENHDQPFFLAVGFVRPHVPWYVPAAWFEPFPVEEVITPPYQPDDMDDVPEMGRRVAEVPMMPTTEWLRETHQWKAMVQAYLASTHFVDAQVGKVLRALQDSRYVENTVIVLWSDHGYHLGEKNRVAKQALWERDTRVVLILRTPDGPGGQRCARPVQLLDIYPTLLELAGLPPNPGNEGHSLVPLLREPAGPTWEHVALTAYGPGNFALRDDRYRLIRYEDGSRELYDLQQDPNEWENLAMRPAYGDIIRRLEAHLPRDPVPLSPHSRYAINAYFRAMSGQ